jgi:hypothetical protein
MRVILLTRWVALPILGSLVDCVWSVHPISALRVEPDPGNHTEILYEPPVEKDMKPIDEQPEESAQAISKKKRTVDFGVATLAPSELSLSSAPEPTVESLRLIPADSAAVAMTDIEVRDVGSDEADNFEVSDPATAEPKSVNSPVTVSRWRKILPWKWGSRKHSENKGVSK